MPVFAGLNNVKFQTPNQIDGANSYDFPVGNIRQECLGLSIVGIVKSGTKTHLFKIRKRNSPVILDLQSLHVLALAKPR
jgi:hypothetical protein